MPIAYADRVKETSTTTGTGTLDLAGSMSRFRTFVAGATDGGLVCYTIEHQTADEWEVGIGVVTDASTDTLSRVTVLSSSNAGALVNFSSGTKNVFLTIPAEGLKAITNRNVIWNGNFDIWQSGTSFASAADSTHVADGWTYYKVGAMVHTVSQSTDVPTVAQCGGVTNYSILVDCTTVDSSIAAGDYAQLVFSQLEGADFAVNLAQRDMTLHFWVKHTKTGVYCVRLANSVGDRSYVAEYTINAADTWEWKVINIPASPSAGTWDYGAGRGLWVSFPLACGSTYQTTAGAWQTGNYIATANQVNACDSTSNNFRIARVKLETGKIATPLAHIPSDVYQKALRYLHIKDLTTTDHIMGVKVGAGWLQSCTQFLPVPMRVVPTWLTSGPSYTVAPAGNQCDFYVPSTATALTITSGAFSIDHIFLTNMCYTIRFNATSFSGAAGVLGVMRHGNGVQHYAVARIA